MTLRKTLLGAALLLSAVAVAQQINPITKAMLDGYQEALNENPKDYFTLYQRAAQYYKLSMYDNALTDIAKALDFTPAKEKDMLAMENSLLADILVEQKQYDKALEAINRLLDLDPDNYAALYKKGNICLYLEQPEEAYRAYSSMRRLKTRSQEAYFGMAKSLIIQGDRSEQVTSLIQEAENADPNNYLTYCRVGDLYNDMDDTPNAAGAYLSAFSLATDSSRPMQSLLMLAAKDYPAVEQAIDYSLTRTTNTVPLNFLKGNLAYFSGNYAPAYEAFKALLENEDAREASVYEQLTRTCLALNRLDEADENAALAMTKQPSAETYMLLSEVARAKGNGAMALLNASKAQKADPQNPATLQSVALANLLLKDYPAAIEVLNEAVMLNADDPMPLALRSYANRESGNTKGAVADNARIILTAGDSFPQVVLKAMAQTANGKKMDGDATMERALAADSGKDALYWAAVYYAQTGELQKGAEAIAKAKDLGFANLYLLDTDTTANLNIAPIRHLLK